jgi:hypothetical protein
MDEFSTTSDTLDQTDEEILTYTASDEALEAAAGTEAIPASYYPIGNCSLVASYC